MSLPKKLASRSATALIGGLILALFVAVLPKWCFHLLLFVLGMLGIREAKRVAENFGYQLFITPPVLTLLLGIASLYIEELTLGLVAYIAGGCAMLLAIAPGRQMEKSLPCSGISLLISAYLGMAIISLVYLFDISMPLESGYDAGRLLVVLTILIIWAGDSAAYLVGSSIGKHKIAPTVSPNKTWEGAIANLLGNFGVLYIASQTFLTELDFVAVVLMTLVFGVLGFFGDLVESSWKRGSHIKDSSSLLPGHGGILDRVDSMFLTAPVFYVYMMKIVLV